MKALFCDEKRRNYVHFPAISPMSKYKTAATTAPQFNRRAYRSNEN